MMELLAAEYDEEPLGNGELEGLSDDYGSQMEKEPEKPKKNIEKHRKIMAVFV